MTYNTPSIVMLAAALEAVQESLKAPFLDNDTSESIAAAYEVDE